jgi:Tfp pilus assembly protein PilN
VIRINLVSEGRKTIAPRRRVGAGVSLQGQNIAFWTLLVVVLVGAIGYGGYWFMLDRDLEKRGEEIAEARRTMSELQSIINEVERFTQRKKALERKVTVITDLRANQRGPVRVMDQVSRALPDLLWLDELALNARSVTIEGRSFTTNSVASFIESLAGVENFTEPILKNTTWDGQVYTFNIVFNYRVVPIRAVRETDQPVAAR